jgi:hypothetical protein
MLSDTMLRLPRVAPFQTAGKAAYPRPHRGGGEAKKFGRRIKQLFYAGERRLVDITKGEMVEAELDAMIRRRDTERRQSEGERGREELWVESVRRYNARLEDDERLERLHFHEGQARRLSNTLGSLVAYHEAEAEKYRNGHKKGDA